MKKVRKIYESVEEAVLESNYEFLTEDDMKKASWSEPPDSKHSCVANVSRNLCASPFLGFLVLCLRKKIRGVKRHCNTRPGWTRWASKKLWCAALCSQTRLTPDPPLPPYLPARKSDYGEGTLYWALVSQKGSKKLLGWKNMLDHKAAKKKL